MILRLIFFDEREDNINKEVDIKVGVQNFELLISF